MFFFGSYVTPQCIRCRSDAAKAKNDGATPLFMAAQNGHAACAEVLLKHGAAVDKARHCFVQCPLAPHRNSNRLRYPMLSDEQLLNGLCKTM